MFGLFPRGIPQDRGRGVRRRRPQRFVGVESLEVRNLLSGATGGGPVLADLPTQFVQEGNRLTFQVRAADPDGLSLRYGLDPGAPDGATIDPTSGLLAWTPPNVQTTYNFSIRITEDGGSGLADVKTLTVMVFNVPPNVGSDPG